MQTDPEKCNPVYIIEDGGDADGLLGGNPPVGVLPAVIENGETEYLLTIPWGSGSELSLFIWLSPLSSHANSAYKHSRVVHGSETRFVHAVIHTKAPRSDDADVASYLPGYGLKIGPTRSDIDPSNPLLPWPSHKLGGRAVFDDAGSPAYGEVDNLLTENFTHVLQLCFPNSEDTLVEGSWPFGEMTFHLFTKRSSQGWDFRFIWG